MVYIQINVSYGVQHELQCLLEGRSDEDLLNVFEDYDKLLRIYHDSIIEVWDVCESVYGFQFRCYFKKHAK